MQDICWTTSAAANSIENHFRDIYRILDEIKDSRDKLETITRSVVRCSRELRSIERIYVNRWRFYGTETLEDPFEIRDILHKFSITCNALKYINSPTAEDEENGPEPGCIPSMGMLPSLPSRRGWKKKQIKALETDFSELERNLALALSNAV
jgi:hypothetical protein